MGNMISVETFLLVCGPVTGPLIVPKKHWNIGDRKGLLMTFGPTLQLKIFTTVDTGFKVTAWQIVFDPYCSWKWTVLCRVPVMCKARQYHFEMKLLLTIDLGIKPLPQTLLGRTSINCGFRVSTFCPLLPLTGPSRVFEGVMYILAQWNDLLLDSMGSVHLTSWINLSKQRNSSFWK